MEGLDVILFREVVGPKSTAEKNFGGGRGRGGRCWTLFHFVRLSALRPQNKLTLGGARRRGRAGLDLILFREVVGSKSQK